MDFRPIASSSAGCAYLLTGEARPLLLDCGVRFPVIQRALQHRTRDLAGVLVSHGHGDHCLAAKDFAHAGIDVWSGAETLDSLGLLGHYRANVIAPDETVSIEGWRVRAFPVVHDAPGSLGFIVSGGGGKLVYMTDTAYSPFRFEGITHWAVECNWSEEVMRQNSAEGKIDTDRYKRVVRNHMSLERLVAMLKANDLSQTREIWLLHLSDGNSDEQAFIDTVRKATGCVVKVAPKSTSGAVAFSARNPGAPSSLGLGTFEETAERR